MADDHTSQAFGLYGTMIDSFAQTNHIQRIAAEGMRLDNVFCTNAICVPSRAAILTGQYSHQNGVYTLSDPLDPALDNVAKQLQAGGYSTAMIGKWHLKREPSGFDYYNVLPGQGRYHNPKLKEKGKPWEDGGAGGEVYEGFSSDVITDQALKWLKNRDSEQPFFMMCHFKATHEPFDYAERYKGLYQDVVFPEPPSLFENLEHRSEATQKQGMFMKDLLWRYKNRADRYPQPALDTTGLSETEQIKAAYQKFMGDYLRGVAGINDNIGRLLAYLDEHNLVDNTVVIYTSDQGYFLGEHGYIDKRMMYEESARMPFVLRYPAEISASTSNDNLILNVDFAPTFLDYANLSIPEQIQGRSFRSILQGETPADWRQSMYYRYWMQERRPAHYGIRTSRYKLIFFYSHRLGLNGQNSRSAPGWELYDLQTDPFEQKNLYGDSSYTKLVEELKLELDQLKFDLADTDGHYPIVEMIRDSLEKEEQLR